MTASRRAGAFVILLVLLVAGLSPARAQVDTEEEWDRNKLKDKTELDRLVEAARLFPLVGKDPPPFTLLGPDGKRVGLSDFAGQVVLLYVWSTTSPYASEELSSTINKLQRELFARRFTVLAVTMRETMEEVAPWVKSRGLSPVFLLDTDGGMTDMYTDMYKVTVAPTLYLIGRDHKLVGRATGTRSWDQGPTRELLDYLLKTPAR